MKKRKKAGQFLPAMIILLGLLSAFLILYKAGIFKGEEEYPSAPAPYFDSADLKHRDCVTFSFDYPAGWDVTMNVSPDEVEEGEVFFEATGKTMVENSFSVFRVVKESGNGNSGIQKIASLDDVSRIIASLSETYGTDVTLIDSGIYDYGDNNCGMTYKASMRYSDSDYTIYQTYFLIDHRIYIFTAVVINGADENDMASVPYSIRFN